MTFDVWDDIQQQFNNVQVSTLAFVVLIICCAGILLKKRDNNSNRLPPGPKGLPIVGNLLSLSLHSEQQMKDWTRIYGPVCRLKFATMDFIILGNLSAITEAFVKKSDVFSDRLQNSIPGISGSSGIIFANYDNRFKEQRRFSLSTLKLFGMGRKSLEPKILELCYDLCNEIEKHNESGKPVEITFSIYERVSAVISQLVFNKNLPKENERFRNWLRIVSTGTKYSAINAIPVFCPPLKVIPPFSWGLQESIEHEKASFSMIQKQIEEHKATRDKKEPRDYIDCFLQEIEDKRNVSDIMSEQQGFNEEQLCGMVRDLFLAGSETTSTTLCWALIFLCKYPHSQSALQKEIDDVLCQRQPSIADGNKMNYAKAVIQETLRMRPVAPIGIPHVAKKDATIMGYLIKKGSCVASNIFSVLHDETLWQEPEKFDPARHLDETGIFVKHPSHIPFAIGARQCLGMQLANMELFLFLVSIFQKFSFELQHSDAIDIRGQNIFTLRPYPFKVFVKQR